MTIEQMIEKGMTRAEIMKEVDEAHKRKEFKDERKRNIQVAKDAAKKGIMDYMNALGMGPTTADEAVTFNRDMDAVLNEIEQMAVYVNKIPEARTIERGKRAAVAKEMDMGISKSEEAKIKEFLKSLGM